MRILVLALSLLLWILEAAAQDVKKVAEIYETQVFANALINGEQVQTLIPARLILYPGDLHGGTTSITMELDSLTTATYIRVPKTSLPVEYEHVFGGDSDRWLNTRPTGGFYSGKLEFDLSANNDNAPGSNNFNVTVKDGTGKPAAGVQVEITPASHDNGPQISLVWTVIGANGNLRVSLPARPTDPYADRNPPGFRPGPTYRMISTDATGQKQDMRFPPIPPNFPAPVESDEVHLALVPGNADAVAYRGTVVDESDAPVPGAKITYKTIDLPGHGMQQFHGEIGTIYTAPDGTYSITVPKDFLVAKTGTEILPSGTILNVTVEGVKGASLLIGRDNRIIVPHTEALTFQLLDSNGQPLEGVDSNRSPNTEITRTFNSDGATSAIGSQATRREILRISAEIISQEQAIIRLPQVPLPGEYRLKFKDYEFEPRLLAKGAGSGTIVLQLSGHRATVSGRVVEAETGAPIAGAYVMGAFNQDSLRELSALTNDQREHVWTKWMNGDKKELFVNDTTIKVDDTKYLNSVRSLTNTNTSGDFLLTYEPGTKPEGVVVYVPRRVGATCNLYTLNKKDIVQSETILPDLALPLKAEVQLTANAPDLIPDPYLLNDSTPAAVPDTNFTAAASFERTSPQWKADLPLQSPGKEAPWELGASTGWFKPGQSVTVAVPAGVNFSVTASAPYTPTLGSVTWSDIGPLQPGAVHSLPAKAIPARRPFLVTVKKADGSPAVGVAVRIDGALPLTTDQNGAVIGWSSGHVRRIQVFSDNSWKIAAEKTDIEVPEFGETVKVDLIIP